MIQPRCTPGKGSLVPIGKGAGWASELVLTWRLEEKSFASAGDQTPVVQSVDRHYTDCLYSIFSNIYYLSHVFFTLAVINKHIE
jgi:hypothetical protein